jgi:LmbE family N-acetylglucosaminyl deacetylase
MPISNPERVLAVMAHPDDVDFGAAGTIAAWVKAGVEVHYCLLTDGDQGGFDDTPRNQMAPMRRAEQQAAADLLGVKSVEFLGNPDGHLIPSVELRGQVVKAIRRVRPQVLLIQTPERNWERIYASHPDHLAAGEIAMQAVYPDARNEFAFPKLLAEGLEPWSVDEVWVMWHATRNHYVDITDTFELKVAALKKHVSQTSHMDALDERLRQGATAMAAEAGLPIGRLAEGYYVVDAR